MELLYIQQTAHPGDEFCVIRQQGDLNVVELVGTYEDCQWFIFEKKIAEWGRDALMDPNETLTKMREAANVLWSTPTTNEALRAAFELRDAFAYLDEWLTKGGFLPQDWDPANG